MNFKVGDLVRVTDAFGSVYGQGPMNIAGKTGIIIKIDQGKNYFTLLINQGLHTLVAVYLEDPECPIIKPFMLR